MDTVYELWKYLKIHYNGEEDYVETVNYNNNHGELEAKCEEIRITIASL